MKLVPELLCRKIEVTKKFYTGVLGFSIRYERPEERFAYFSRDCVDIMVEEFEVPGRHWITGELELPFGRGINFQWEVKDIKSLYEHVKATSPNSIYMDIETKTYDCGGKMVAQTQFLVQDPDGYLFRFCNEEK